MTNNQIIRNEAARLDPATLHAIATAHHTPDEIAAIAAACKTTDENGNEQPATVADVEIMLAADELHTFDHWKKEGKSVKKGEKHLVCCYLCCQTPVLFSWRLQPRLPAAALLLCFWPQFALPPVPDTLAVGQKAPFSYSRPVPPVLLHPGLFAV